MRPAELYLLQNKKPDEPSEEFLREQAEKHQEVYRAAIMWVQEHGYGVMWNSTDKFVLYKKTEPLTEETQWRFEYREDAYRKAFELIAVGYFRRGSNSYPLSEDKP